MNSICEPAQCTMCNACANICSQNCIIHAHDGAKLYMVINSDKCILCHRCEKVCPIRSAPEWNVSRGVFAAWATDGMTRHDSASGGAASTLYQWALDNNMGVVGAVMDENFEVHLQISRTPQYLQKFRNSKYTFSFSDDIYKEVLASLNRNEGVIFIGLPCQVAGLKNYLRVGKAEMDRLYTVDLICHGTPAPEYLQEHIQKIEEKQGVKADRIYFRDPRYGTGNFLFTIYGKQIISTDDRKFSDNETQDSPAYKKMVMSDDLYQIGYHSGWIYRDCCYQCQYAQKKRCGDLTLGDSHGLGKVESFKGSKDNISFVFTNSVKGQMLLTKLVEEGYLAAEERPLEEPYRFEPQLSHPSVGGDSMERRIFIDNLANGFENAASVAFKEKQTTNRKKEILHIYTIKKAASHVVPEPVKKMIRKIR